VEGGGGKFNMKTYIILTTHGGSAIVEAYNKVDAVIAYYLMFDNSFAVKGVI
jgi:hypothetical protein